VLASTANEEVEYFVEAKIYSLQALSLLMANNAR